MMDMTGIRPPGSPFEKYLIDDRLPRHLSTLGLESREVSDMLHDVGCGQLEALVRLSETLGGARMASIHDGDGTRVLLFETPVAPGVEWSAGWFCSFLRVPRLPETVATLLPGRKADAVAAIPAATTGRTILSITDHEDASTVVMSARLTHAARHVGWRSRLGATARQEEAQARTFGKDDGTPQPTYTMVRERPSARHETRLTVILTTAAATAWSCWAALALRILGEDAPTLIAAAGAALVTVVVGVMAERWMPMLRQRRAWRRPMPVNLAEAARRVAAGRDARLAAVERTGQAS